jgi:hypothetical protein
MNILSQYLSPSDLETLEAWAPTLNYKPVPEWLGNFETRMFGAAYGKEHGHLPREIDPLVKRLLETTPDARWTTCFLQKYVEGSYVNSHRDPRNNHNRTCILAFGSFTGAVTLVETRKGPKRFQLERGDVLVLPATSDGVQGPEHSVSRVTSGIRYALVLNLTE